MLQNAINQNDMSEVYALTEQLFIQPLEKVNPAAYPDVVKNYFVHYGLDAGPGRQIEHLLQGDSDGTVDWYYNLKLIGRKFPKAEIQIIEGANHELFNESPVFRKQAMVKIAQFFKKTN